MKNNEIEMEKEIRMLVMLSLEIAEDSKRGVMLGKKIIEHIEERYKRKGFDFFMKVLNEYTKARK